MLTHRGFPADIECGLKKPPLCSEPYYEWFSFHNPFRAREFFLKITVAANQAVTATRLGRDLPTASLRQALQGTYQPRVVV